MGFLNFLHMPGPTGVAAQFFGAIFVSHFYVVIFLLQIGACPAVAGQTATFLWRSTILGPIILQYRLHHAFMAPAGLPLAVVVTSSGPWWRIRFRSAFSRNLAAGIAKKGGEQNRNQI